jgi:metallo-beta-lactamase family protein
VKPVAKTVVAECPIRQEGIKMDVTFPVKAHVTELGGFSTHGDKQELLRFIRESNLNIKRIAVGHGQEDQALAFAGHLRQTGYPVLVPKRGETIRL